MLFPAITRSFPTVAIALTVTSGGVITVHVAPPSFECLRVELAIAKISEVVPENATLFTYEIACDVHVVPPLAERSRVELFQRATFCPLLLWPEMSLNSEDVAGVVMLAHDVPPLVLRKMLKKPPMVLQLGLNSVPSEREMIPPMPQDELKPAVSNVLPESDETCRELLLYFQSLLLTVASKMICSEYQLDEVGMLVKVAPESVER